MARIQKVLSLGDKEFNSGIGAGYFTQSKGIWQSAYGFKTYKGSNDTGVLYTGDTGTEVAAGTVVQNLRAHTVDTSFGYTYMLGDSGHIYGHLSDNGLYYSFRGVTPITSANHGLELYQPQAGTKYVYYWQNTQIGRWDTVGVHPTGWIDNHFTGLTSSNHFTHQFFGDAYYTNGDKIGKISNNAGTAANNVNVLDFPAYYTSNSLSDDGTYLIIGLTTQNTYNTGTTDSKILFWDTFSPSWNKEYTIPEGFIYAIRKTSYGIYAFTDFGIYEITFYAPPKLVVPFNSTDAPSKQTDVTVWNNFLYWVSSTTNKFVGTFGRKWSLIDSYQQPFKLTNVGEYLLPLNSTKLLISSNLDLFSYDYTTLGTAVSLTANSINFDLGDEYKIQSVYLVFADELASGDAVTVALLNEQGGTENSWGAASFTTHGAVKRVELPAGVLTTETLSLKLTIDGKPQIRRIDVYGERLNDY